MTPDRPLSRFVRPNARTEPDTKEVATHGFFLARIYRVAAMYDY